jgi:hypothetical protein
MNEGAVILDEAVVISFIAQSSPLGKAPEIAEM